ncbi:MAG: hypothetical protein AAB897_02855 [Patescibacteria group bacterium]
MARRKVVLHYFGPAIAVISITAFGLWFGVEVSENDLAQGLISAYGYIGIFLFAIVSGFNLAFPVPAITFLPAFQAAGLNIPFAVILIIAGMSIGDLGGYLIGKTGRLILSPQDKHIATDLEKIKEKYRIGPLVALFLFAAFIPVPNELLVVPLSFLGYRLSQIFFVTLAGNAVFNALAALTILRIFRIAT